MYRCIYMGMYMGIWVHIGAILAKIDKFGQLSLGLRLGLGQSGNSANSGHFG